MKDDFKLEMKSLEPMCTWVQLIPVPRISQAGYSQVERTRLLKLSRTQRRQTDLLRIIAQKLYCLMQRRGNLNNIRNTLVYFILVFANL